MYLHLGQHTTIRTRDVIGVFDLDTTSISKRTREYLARAEKDKKVINTSYELPKSFVVTAGKQDAVYISQLSASTLKKRVEQGKISQI